MTRLRQWITRLRDARSEHRAIAQGIAWVGIFVLIGKAVGAAKEMAIAYRYGVGAEVDAYLFVYNLVNWPVSVWFSVLTLVLVPLVARIAQGAPEDLPRFRSELLGLTFLLGLALALLNWLGMPLLLHSSWAGLPDGTVALAAHIAPTLALLAPLGVVTSLFSAWMLAAGRHTNTLLEGVPALAILVVLLICSGGGIEPLVWGTLVGFALHSISLAWPLMRHGDIAAPRLTRSSPQWTPFWRGFGILLAGQALMSPIGIIDQFFAAHLGTGSIATLNYTNRVLSLILGLGGTAATRSMLPVFSNAYAQGDGRTNPYRIATQWMWLMFALGILAVIVGWWLAPWVVEILFQRGAFTAKNAGAVSEVLRYGMTQFPFYFAGLVLVSSLATQARYRAIAAIAGINLVIKVVGNFVMVPSFGLNGLVMSTTCMYFVSMVLCWLVVRRVTH